MNRLPSVPRLAPIDRSQLLLHTVDVETLIEEDHSARAIWQLIGGLDLSLYYAKIAAVEGQAGRNHTAPQLLISLWLYAYSQGISSAREIARRCVFEPGFAWLSGLQPISHRTLSGFRSDHQEALDNLFVQVVGMLSAEGLITMQRITLDGTKIKANASGNTFRRKEKIEAHLALAREQVQKMNEQAAEEEKTAKRRAAAKRRASRQRASRLEAALRAVERLQQVKRHDQGELHGTSLHHGPGSSCNAKWRRRYGTQLQRATADGYDPRAGGECRGDHRRYRLPPTERGSRALSDKAGSATRTNRSRWRLYQSRIRASCCELQGQFLRLLAR